MDAALIQAMPLMLNLVTDIDDVFARNVAPVA